MIVNGDSVNAGGDGVIVVLPIYSIQDWIGVQDKLSKVSSVKKIDIQALKYDKAQLVLKYTYDLSSLVAALRHAGFVVEQKSNYLRIVR